MFTLQFAVSTDAIIYENKALMITEILVNRSKIIDN